MAAQYQHSIRFRALALLILLYFLFSSYSTTTANAGVITTYWGQNVNEGDLDTACKTRNYGIINIAFLYSFGNHSTPKMDLSGHCSPSTQDCSWLSTHILACQQLGVKTFLSIGGGTPQYYTLVSTEDARELATYIWDNFLGGQSNSRPLGDAVLDGVDFDLEGGKNEHWDELAQFLSEYNNPDKTVYLSAAPQCVYPDATLGKAIETGLFDYVWVQFYNNPGCMYVDGSANKLISSWNNNWTKIDTDKLFLGLPAAPQAAPNGGYIPPPVLISDVLPSVKTSSKYGGVMLWSRYWDNITHYSDAIKPYV